MCGGTNVVLCVLPGHCLAHLAMAPPTALLPTSPRRLVSCKLKIKERASCMVLRDSAKLCSPFDTVLLVLRDLRWPHAGLVKPKTCQITLVKLHKLTVVYDTYS